MRTRSLLLALLAAVAVVGCVRTDASATTESRTGEAMRAAAIRLLFADANATALPRAYDREVLRRRMRRYVASRWLDRRVERTASAIAKVGGRRYFQSWTEAITVGRWEHESLTDSPATVVFVGYDTICPSVGAPDLPLQRLTVRMVRERGRWRLADHAADWLTPAGPMGESGAATIGSLPERVVFRNRRPLGWRYNGPRTPDLVPCR